MYQLHILDKKADDIIEKLSHKLNIPYKKEEEKNP